MTEQIPQNGTKVRLEMLEKILDKQADDIESLTKSVGELQVDIARLQERMTIFQAAQAVFTTIAGVAAAFVGRL